MEPAKTRGKGTSGGGGTVHQLEAGTSMTPRRATLQAICRAFEVAGVEFIEENGGQGYRGCGYESGNKKGS